ncbi:MAG: peptide deformylase [Candidatus Vidania fulgoroideorum]
MIIFFKLINKKSFFNYKKKKINFKRKYLKKVIKENKGIAISKIQIGIRIKNFTLKYKNKIYNFKNIKIDWKSKEKNKIKEGCLSLINKYNIKRSKFIKINAKNKTKYIKNFVSICIQHEYNHCIGKTIKNK